MIYETLVSVETLAAHLNDPGWIIIDCRFDLQNPDWGLEEYRHGHIPGAVYAHLNADLSAPVTPTTGRHPLPNPEDFIGILSAWGVNSTRQVVAYDSGRRSLCGAFMVAAAVLSPPGSCSPGWGVRQMDSRKPSSPSRN